MGGATGIEIRRAIVLEHVEERPGVSALPDLEARDIAGKGEFRAGEPSCRAAVRFLRAITISPVRCGMRASTGGRSIARRRP